MFDRITDARLSWLLARFPAIALVGPRQVGKKTMALAHRQGTVEPLYLDLELPSARRRLDDPEAFLLAQRHRLLILDEVQRMPGLFEVLRGVIDLRRREGESAGQFLLLGSASGALLQQGSESLAGRMATLELTPFLAAELLAQAAPAGPADPVRALQDLWVRGGFPL
ncbi:MAG: AAA family ATPase [Rubrivivax sp.]|nr:AAA family ATPase [Rubrivivax sp.]